MENEKLGQVMSYALSTGVAWFVPEALLAPEFRGGLLTGGLLRLHIIGTYIFLSALLMSLLYRRIAAAEALAASLCCLPLYFFVTAPGMARRLFGDDNPVPLRSSFALNGWAALGILGVAVAVTVSVSTFLSRNSRRVASSKI